MVETLNETREKQILKFLEEPLTIAQLAGKCDLSYHAIYRHVKTLEDRQHIKIVGYCGNRERLYQSSFVAYIPKFKMPTGQEWTINDFVTLYKNNPGFQFESARMTNLLPQMFVEVYSRALDLYEGKAVSPSQREEWRNFLQHLEIQLRNSLSVVVQTLASRVIWEDDELKLIFTDVDALTPTSVRELVEHIHAIRLKEKEQEDVSST